MVGTESRSFLIHELMFSFPGCYYQQPVSGSLSPVGAHSLCLLAAVAWVREVLRGA